MDTAYTELLTDKGVIGVLAAFILFLFAMLKVLFDMWKTTEKEKDKVANDLHELSKDIVGIVFKYENKIESYKEESIRINSKLDSIQNAIERNK